MRRESPLAKARTAVAVVLLLATACGPARQSPQLRREGRLGTLRDLVLFERVAAAGGPFFLDRFEATRGDFAAFQATAVGQRELGELAPLHGDEAALPMAGIDLRQARAFAQWRCCRLPRSDEWTFACTTDGRDLYPWGSVPSASRANTSDLGVFEPLPVGTFESGRTRDGPYDLIGNVAEWTETVPLSWFRSWRAMVSPLASALRDVERRPALACWRLPGGVLSPMFAIAAAGDGAPREVLGGDFASAMADGPQLRAPSDRSATVGVRLCTTPKELLRALAAVRGELTAKDQQLVERFAHRERNAAVLRAALDEAELEPAARAWIATFLP